MKPYLHYLLIFSLFLPFIGGCVLLEIPHIDLYAYQKNFVIANFLTSVSFYFIIAYQAKFAFAFNELQIANSKLFKINLLLPPTFFTIYLIYLTYSFLFLPVIHTSYMPGPIRKADLNFTGTITLIFLIYGLINFLFVNNQFVSMKIKRLTDYEERESLKAIYLNPMKRIVRFFLVFIGVSLIISTIHDIITFGIMK